MAVRELEKTYDPGSVERRIYERWIAANAFRVDTARARRPFVIPIPPPNVTGILHMGHVLDLTIQDVTIRWRRMQGWDALWLPGMDHAGIATQNVVEKALAKEGLRKEDLGREAFIARVWAWKEEFGGAILTQFREMGFSLDWDRFAFTMDEPRSRAVTEAFLRLHRDGLVYRGNYIVNWCPRCRTALSDEEVNHRDVEGKLYYIRYPLKGGGGHVTVATTRPETMLGDVAVAVHPTDRRQDRLRGRTAILPIVGRELPVIEDEYVDPAFGAGALKVTPGHDPNDFLLGNKHRLPAVDMMTPEGNIAPGYGDLSGLDRFEARKRIVERLEAGGLLEKVVPHAMALGECDRCETVVEPRLSEQWFVRMKPLAEPAIRAHLDGRVTIAPKRWSKVYLHWMENIRDWCISRQLWWGHRIPVWYCPDGHATAAADTPAACGACGAKDLRQDPDVLDTWFSSWLWPMSTLGWPEETPDLRKFYPGSLLVTGPDIIFFWVARMIMAGLRFREEVPFRAIYLHGIVRDEKGRKLSKSLGNSPDPLEFIRSHGADALRFTTMYLSPSGQDTMFSAEKLDTGRFFANKIWNASRLALRNLEGFEPGRVREESLSLALEDRWILSCAEAAARETTALLEEYRYDEAAKTIHDFAWKEYCDWYLEFAKVRYYGEGDRTAVQWVTWKVLATILLLLHPFMPFLTEEIWSFLPGSEGLLMLRPWPAPEERRIDPGAEREMALVQETIVAIRNVRAEMGIPPGRKLAAIVRAGGADRAVLEASAATIVTAANLESLAVDPDHERPGAAAAAVAGGHEIFLPLEGVLDLAKERERLRKELEKLTRYLETSRRKLENADFLDRAPAEVVEKERQRIQEGEETRRKLARNLLALGEEGKS